MFRYKLGLVIPLLVSLVLSACGPNIASGDLANAAITFGSMDLRQGFNYSKDVQNSYGYVSALTIGTTTLPADLAISDGSSSPVIGVLTSETWNGGVSDPIQLKFNVSTANSQALNNLLHTQLSNTNVSVAFRVNDYDPIAKKYFVALTGTTNPLKGIVARNGTALQLTVASSPNTDVRSPQNWQVSLGVAPSATAQTLTFATSSTQSLVKRWGTTTG